jgi:hypothetical protein
LHFSELADHVSEPFIELFSAGIAGKQIDRFQELVQKHRSFRSTIREQRYRVVYGKEANDEIGHVINGKACIVGHGRLLVPYRYGYR